MGRGGPQRSETSSVPHFLDNRLTHGLRAGHPLAPRRFLVLISVRGWVDPRNILRLEGLGQLKNPVTSLEIKPRWSGL
jgi:hypothetical protein